MYKQRLDASGRPKKEAEKHDVHMTKAPPKTGNTTCGPCYGAEDAPGACCNTCDEVRTDNQGQTGHLQRDTCESNVFTVSKRYLWASI